MRGACAALTRRRRSPQVLRFYAYFEEAVPNSRAETSRVRKCVNCCLR
jgi:hypothetical protein